MISGDGLTDVDYDSEVTGISNFLQQESVVDVEIPVRGLLVKESIVVCKCADGRIEAQSSNISHFCTGAFNYPLFIKVGNKNKSLTCRLSDLLVYSGKLFLNDFQLMNQVWVDRQCERVQPKAPTFVTLVKGKMKVKANLFDLSQTGMGILVDQQAFSNLDMSIESEIKILLNLPPKNALCSIKGRVVQSRKISDNLVHIGMSITMPKRDASLIAHYLSDRKREILDELFLNFLGLMNYRDTKDQYF